MSGNLIVRPLSARLTHGTELFGKMDPLVKVIVGNHIQRTPAVKKGHKNPTWDTELSLRRTNEDIIRFEVWDKDVLTKNDLIGAGELPFSRIFAQNGMFKDWVPLFYKNKPAGELLVNIEFIPDYGVDMAMVPGQQQMVNQQPIAQQTTTQTVQQQPGTLVSQIQRPEILSPTMAGSQVGMAGGNIPVTTQKGFEAGTQTMQPGIQQQQIIPQQADFNQNYQNYTMTSGIISQESMVQNLRPEQIHLANVQYQQGFQQQPLLQQQNLIQQQPGLQAGLQANFGDRVGMQSGVQAGREGLMAGIQGKLQPLIGGGIQAGAGGGGAGLQANVQSQLLRSGAQFGGQIGQQNLQQQTGLQNLQQLASLQGNQFRDPLNREAIIRNERFSEAGYPAGYNAQTGLSATENLPGRLGDLERNREIDEGYVPGGDQKDFMRSGKGYYPGYSTGVIGYQPIIGQPQFSYEDRRFDERRFDDKRFDDRRFDDRRFDDRRFETQQWNQQQLYQQPLYQQQQFQSPSYLRDDLANIEQRITRQSIRPIDQYDRGYLSPTYLRESNVLLQKENILQQPTVEGKMQSFLPTTTTQTTVLNQLPGVLTNTETFDSGKYVAHQGGTHSQVGSVQSHRILSNMADKPNLTSKDLDREARIALGEIPRDYYGENR
jgi:hypothetical protein